jgi:hypothetical protein
LGGVGKHTLLKFPGKLNAIPLVEVQHVSHSPDAASLSKYAKYASTVNEPDAGSAAVALSDG